MIGKTISHYKILEKLGEGGMGVVYKAEDIKLERTVAIKFLPRQITANSEERERFKIEAKAAASLNHPNIATIHAIEEVDGDIFIVMEYIKGKELKELTTDDGELSIEDVTNYATQIAEGLKAAHEKDVTHRDIKSANIMITDKGQIKIMDFGLAKVRGGAQVTKVGTTLGTAAYMSPEQAQGMKTDHRTDIWAFGVVVYEMLSGQMPFPGDYEQAVIYSILNEEPKSPNQLRSDVPISLDKLILKTLEKDKENRYKNFQEILNELKAPSNAFPTEVESEKSIIVLPFVNMSPDPDQDYFSDGLTEEIITDLSQIQNLLVISRSSAMTFKGTKKKIKEIAKEVNVQYVLEGSVRKAGNNLRITAQLIDAAKDAHLWAEKYKGTLTDLFDIQEEVSRKIVDALRFKLSVEEDRKMSERAIDNVQAYEYYIHARREIYKGSEEGLKRALQELQLGLEIVGENALLNKGMAEVYLNYYEYGGEANEETLLNVEKYANKIIALQPDSADSNYLLGRIERFRGSASKAAKYFKKAYALNPDNTDVLLFLGAVYGIAVGKTSLAEQMFKRLLEIDPFTPFNYAVIGVFQTVAGQLEKALLSFKKMTKLAQEDMFERFLGVYIYAWQKRYDKVYEVVDQMVNQKSQGQMYDLITEWCLFFKYALQGEKLKALDAESKDAKEFIWNDPDIPWMGICNYALINEKEEALHWLEHVIDRGFINYPFLNERIPFLENIRNTPRFKQVMKRVKYEWENFEV